jgi:hypothetical protein
MDETTSYAPLSYAIHNVWTEEGRVWLSNDHDTRYKQDFLNRKELDAFIEKLRTMADKAWPN